MSGFDAVAFVADVKVAMRIADRCPRREHAFRVGWERHVKRCRACRAANA